MPPLFLQVTAQSQAFCIAEQRILLRYDREFPFVKSGKQDCVKIEPGGIMRIQNPDALLVTVTRLDRLILQQFLQQIHQITQR